MSPICLVGSIPLFQFIRSFFATARGRSVAVLVGVGWLLANGQLCGQGAVFGDERPRLPGRVGVGAYGAVAELTGDANPDVLRVTDAGLDVLVQGASGSFDRRALLPLPDGVGAPVGVACGQFQIGSSRRDVLVQMSATSTLWFRNNGLGDLQPVHPSPLPRSGGTAPATQLLIADFDAQFGDDVLVVYNQAPAQVFLSTATGTFRNVSNLGWPGLQRPAAVAADFTRDGLTDVVLVARSALQPPVLLVNQGGAVFAVKAGAFSTVYPASHVCAADVSGDGLPDVVLTSATPLSNDPVAIFRNLGNATFAAATLSLPIPGVVECSIGDLDRNGAQDLVLVKSDGAVAVAIAQGGGFPQVVDVLGPAPRVQAWLGDIENDGDLDVLALGQSIEDSLLLGNGAGAFLATEDVTMPFGLLAGGSELALLDVSGEGDPDVVGYETSGLPLAWINDGTDRFRSANGLVPSLAPANVRAVTALAAVQPAVRGDLLVIGQLAGSPVPTLQLMVRTVSGLQNQTQLRLPNQPPAGLFLAAVGAFGGLGSGFDDIVALDPLGLPVLYHNRGGNYVVRPGAFGGATLPNATELVVGQVDANASDDVVVLMQNGPPVVFLQSNGVFTPAPGSLVGAMPSLRSALADVNLDGITDLLVVGPAVGGGTTLYQLYGLGGGRFFDASSQGPTPLPVGLTTLTVLGRPAQPTHLLLGSGVQSDVVFPILPGGYGPASLLPDSGSQTTSGLLAADLESDGDQDLVVVRRAAYPRVLFGLTSQITDRGVTTLGRVFDLRLRAPGPGILALFTFSGSPGRVFFPPIEGIIRVNLATLSQVLSVPIPATGMLDLVAPTPAGVPPAAFPLQGAFFDPAAFTVEMTNLELFQLVVH